MSLFRDTVTIHKMNGEKIAGVTASVQKKVHFKDVTLPIEDGDIIEQELPSGLVKKMLVTDVRVYSGYGRLDHIEVEYTKA